MKANESLQNYNAKLRESTNFIVREIKKTCADIGSRESGEASERKAQEYIASTMKDVADSVEIEDFEVHPKAFMGWVIVDGTLMLLSVLFINLSSFLPNYSLGLKILAFVCTVLSVFFLLTEFLFYRQVLDPFFPKRTSCNVVCTKKPSGEIKRRLVLGGHMDSAYEWTYTHLGGGRLLKAVIISAIFALVVSFSANLAAFFFSTGIILSILGYVQIALVPMYIAVMFFVNWKLVVPGANDNLTGAFGVMAIMRFLKVNNLNLENTELICISTGCEEAGLRGAKAFAKKHAKEYSDVETLFIGIDTLRDYEHLAIYNEDMSGTVTLDKQAAFMLKKACENAEVEVPFSKVYFGSSDAAAIQQGGIRSIALAAMDPTPPRYYHTRDDVPESLVPKSIEACINIALETTFLFDEQGLKDNY